MTPVTEEKEMPSDKKQKPVQSKPKFELATREDPDKTDDVGSVQIQILLREKGSNAKKGNITKTLTVKNARVSDVYEHIRNSFL